MKEKKIFFLVFIEMQMYGPRQESRTLPWAKCQIFLQVLFICNNINTNLIKKIFKSAFHSFKPLFLFFEISPRTSLKKFQSEKWPKAGYLPLFTLKNRQNDANLEPTIHHSLFKKNLFLAPTSRIFFPISLNFVLFA